MRRIAAGVRSIAAIGVMLVATAPIQAQSFERSHRRPPLLLPSPAFAPQLDTVRLQALDRSPQPATLVIRLMLLGLTIIVALISIYSIRHYVFAISRMFGRQRHPYSDIITAEWPPITVLIPAHNEELVIGEMLRLLLNADYPRDRLTIIPINDRSEDRTGEIIDSYAARYPGVVAPFHRSDAKGGKAAALQDAEKLVQTDIELVFDADYLPARGVLKLLVAPFFDPEVGAVMGRVIPINLSRNFLTRLQELERSGGYQVDQQARMNLALVPQYGGTVGGVRRRALAEIGGWKEESLAEDTDLTYRLLLHGHLTAYENRAECYEEVPEVWPERIRQIKRWSQGHNACLRHYLLPLLRSNMVGGMPRKIDGLLLLGVFALPPFTIIGWLLGLGLFYLGYIPIHGFVAILAVTAYSTLGNFAAFFQVAAAVRLDGSRARIRLLPLLLGGFLISTVAIVRSMLPRHLRPSRNTALIWDKTKRYRQAQE
ncbi:MAG: glycosyltransferase [Gemmatimonadaceae bacterium]